MKSLFYIRTLLLLALALLLALQAQATHMRAGEITLRAICSQSLTYEITLRGYTDPSSTVIFGSNGTLDFGDGTSLVINNQGDDIPRTALSPDTWLYELKVIHTFPSAGSYSLSFREFYRNDAILNMDNSVQMPFYIETLFIVDPLLGTNHTPQLLVHPIDKAVINKPYVHNPGAYDVDGDSLSYRLAVCRQDRTIPVANYRYPHQTFPAGDPRNGSSVSGGPPEFTMNPLTGDLVWNSPGTPGEYNVAFLIEEWRKIEGKYYSLGYVTRDMQIVVGDHEDNSPPELIIPEEICVLAGEKIEEIIQATDPDGHTVDLLAYGGVFNRGAVFPGASGADAPVQSVFSWQTSCADVRTQPYQVVFVARDSGGGIRLTNIKTLNIRVVAPPPVVERLQPMGNRAAEVDFDPNAYGCSQALRIQVWRRQGSIDIPLDTCVAGMPPTYRYQLVDVRKPDDFPFIDNDNWQGLHPGATYCYRFVAVFSQLECAQGPASEIPQPDFGLSLVSEELCVTLPAKVPLIMNVSVEETAATGGQILLRWMPDPELTEEEVSKPYHYDLYRAEGYRGGAYTRIAANLTDTVFIDSSAELNTKNLVYNYYLRLKDGNGVEFDSSSTASSVRVEPLPGAENITLQWKAQVPWTNAASQFPLHDIYRNRVDSDDPDKLVRIAQVNILRKEFSYVDNGTDAGTGPLQHNVEYCYYVVTAGTYSNPNVPEPLLNSSQRVCTYLKDEVPPCPPRSLELMNLTTCEVFLRETSCSTTSFENVLEWTINTDALCRDNLAYWQIYYSPDGTDFDLIGTSVTNRFVHQLQDNPAGYYYLIAVDRSGNLSTSSPVVMRDNCPNYWLPNVITRNGDGLNDVLRPPLPGELDGRPDLYYRCPRFVESVVFTVYNRWGKVVYSYASANRVEPDIYIRWDGRGSNGMLLSSGTYYYVANVTYRTLDPAKRKQKVKGWVYLIEPGGSQ